MTDGSGALRGVPKASQRAGSLGRVEHLWTGDKPDKVKPKARWDDVCWECGRGISRGLLCEECREEMKGEVLAGEEGVGGRVPARPDRKLAKPK